MDTRPAIAIRSPLAGPGWGALNGCCVPNIHRSVRIAAGTRLATPETFAIDWIRIDNGRFFEGDGKTNEQYPYFGDDVLSVADGDVVALHDGMPESIPFEPPTTVHKPEDYGGNYVLVRIADGTYALYAHLQPGSISVKVGDRIRPAPRSASSATAAIRPTRISISALSTGRRFSPGTVSPLSSKASTSPGSSPAAT